MPEQRGDLGEAQLAVARTLDQREQRAEFLFGGNQRGEAGAQGSQLARNADRRFAAQGVGVPTHTGATAPELSSWIV